MPVCQQNSGIHTVRGVLCLQERFLVDNYAFDASIQLHSRAGMGIYPRSRTVFCVPAVMTLLQILI